MGKTWTALATPDIEGYCHVIRQDPVNPDLLYLGTEKGLFISLDKGARWIRFKNKVPQTGIRDMAFQIPSNDLVLATHGRGIIIIDDLTPLRNLKSTVLEKDFAFLPVRPYYFTSETGIQDFGGDAEFTGSNPSMSASICYYLKKRHIFGEMYLEIYDPAGKFLKKLPAGTRKGINIVQMSTSLDPPRVPQSPNILGEAAFGPEYMPGTYGVKVVKGDQTFETSLVLNDIRNSPHSESDRKLQRSTLMQAYHLLEELADVDNRILQTRDTLAAWEKGAKGSRLKKIRALIAECDGMHGQISATQPGEGGIAGQVRLREEIAEIYSAVGGYRGRPTNLQMEALDIYSGNVEDFATQIDHLIENKLPALR
jgi:hypothetical protein